MFDNRGCSLKYCNLFPWKNSELPSEVTLLYRHTNHKALNHKAKQIEPCYSSCSMVGSLKVLQVQSCKLCSSDPSKLLML